MIEINKKYEILIIIVNRHIYKPVFWVELMLGIVIQVNKNRYLYIFLNMYININNWFLWVICISKYLNPFKSNKDSYFCLYT